MANEKPKSKPKQKSKLKKYYAIKVGRGVKDKIVRTWEECKSFTDGCYSVFQSFKTMEEAEEFFGSVNVEKVREQTKFVIEKKKKVKATTTLVQARILNESYAKYVEKCNENGWEIGEGINKLIDEWIY